MPQADPPVANEHVSVQVKTGTRREFGRWRTTTQLKSERECGGNVDGGRLKSRVGSRVGTPGCSPGQRPDQDPSTLNTSHNGKTAGMWQRWTVADGGSTQVREGRWRESGRWRTTTQLKSEQERDGNVDHPTICGGVTAQTGKAAGMWFGWQDRGVRW